MNGRGTCRSGRGTRADRTDATAPAARVSATAASGTPRGTWSQTGSIGAAVWWGRGSPHPAVVNLPLPLARNQNASLPLRPPKSLRIANA
jgi:hypothetical protein